MCRFLAIGFAATKGAPVAITQLNELSEQIPVLAETYNGALSHIHRHTSHWPDGLHDRLDRLIVQSETYAANGAERMILSCKVLLDYALVAALFLSLSLYGERYEYNEAGCMVFNAIEIPKERPRFCESGGRLAW